MIFLIVISALSAYTSIEKLTDNFLFFRIPSLTWIEMTEAGFIIQVRGDEILVLRDDEEKILQYESKIQ